jgi:hypothetical protein
VLDGTIRWLFHHELRGESVETSANRDWSQLPAGNWQPVRFARVLTPDTTSAGRIVVSLIGEHGRNLCITAVDGDRLEAGRCAASPA